MTNTEKQKLLIEKLSDYIARYVEENSPVTRSFPPYSLAIDVCGTDNMAILKVSRDILQDDPPRLRLQLSVVRKGTDRLYSNFLPAGDAQQILQNLRDPEVHNQWLEQIEHLSRSVDDYWD